MASTRVCRTGWRWGIPGTRHRRRFLSRSWGVLAAGWLALAARSGAPAAQPPNFVVILVDDLRWDDPGYAGNPLAPTPQIDRLAAEGLFFENAFATTPLCSPSRASFLTGLYARTHGIRDNTDRSLQSHRLNTFPRQLQEAGYRTAFIGKWHMGNDDRPRPGFDSWVGLQGQGQTLDPWLNEDGKRSRARGYVTDVLTDRAVAFLRRAEAPFLLYLAHKALHPELVQYDDGSISDPSASRFIPAERHRALYAGARVSRRPNAFRPPRDKPALLRPFPGLEPLGPGTGTRDETILDRWRMLRAVDESVGRIVEVLAGTGQLDRTLLVVTSDHAYFYGEHGLSVERRLAYEEAIRIPLLLRYPPLIPASTSRRQLVLNLDLAPTVLELAGRKERAESLQGRSLVPLFSGPAPDWRDAFLIEYFSDTVFPRVHRMGYQAVRSERYKYIRYSELEGMDELYDLEEDPYEMHNLLAGSQAGPLLERMQALLERLLGQGSGGRGEEVGSLR